MQLLVLGTHGSGTSSIRRLLHLAGVHDGNVDAGGNRPELPAVCDGLLRGGGYDWWRIADLDLGRITEGAGAEQLERFRRLVVGLDGHRPWVLEDPRLCVLWPLLRPMLEAPVVVHVHRDPLEVADWLTTAHDLPRPVALALWEAYTAMAVVAGLAGPAVAVAHADLVSDPVGTTASLVAELQALGVPGLQVPPPAQILDLVPPAAVQERQDHRALLTLPQLELLAAITEGAPDTTVEVSPAAWEVLRSYEASRDHEEELRRQLAASQAERDAAERTVRELRSDRTRLEATTVEAAASLDQALQSIRPLRRSRVLKVAAWLQTPARRRSKYGLQIAVARTTDHVQQARRELEQATQHGGAPFVPLDAEPPPVDVLRARRRSIRSQGGRTKVAVLVWDVGHNPFGRAHLLADLLSDRYEVELWGAQFDRYGSAVWAPMRSTYLPVIRLPGSDFPDFFETLQRSARHIDADVLYVSKSRLPSVALGALAKESWNRHLVVDVDDFEPSFFDESEGIDPRHLLWSDDPDLALPFGRSWTQACEAVVCGADAITVSNAELQARYGGSIVPHARNEATFDPARFDRTEVRRRLGIAEEDRLILFGGTPRKHKGILEILDAVHELGNERVRVGAFASRELDEVMRHAGDRGRWLVPLTAPTFEELPAVLAAADLTSALQAADHPVSRFQMPAKVTDALAMQVPCLVTPVAPLQPLLDRDVLEVHDVAEPLAERLLRFFDDPDAARERARRGREVFLEEYSYGAVRPVLAETIEAGVDDPAPPDPRLGALVSTLRSRYGGGSAGRPPATRRPVPPGDTYDLVVFWKQNDTGIYGRRQDMFVKYLEASGRFGTIVHFDLPMSAEGLLRNARKSIRSNDQTRLVVRQTVRRLAGRADRGRLRQRTFLYGRSKRFRRAGLPPEKGFVDYVRTVLAREGVGERPVVFWTYPRMDFLPSLIDELAPDLVVTDVVDDYRAWHEPDSPRWTEADRNYREVLSRSDIVLANCDAVGQSIREFSRDVHVIPNACEVGLVGRRGRRPAELRDLTGPIVGYAGNLSARIDLQLLRDLVHGHPEWNFVVVGSTHRDRSILEITSHPNVRFVGAKPYEKTVALIRHFDVAIIPHLDNDVSRSMNPLKAYVYAAAGVPIVATPVANLDDLADFITVAEGAEAFAKAIASAIERGRPAISRAALEPHGWEVRVRDAMRLVDGELDRLRRDGREASGPPGGVPVRHVAGSPPWAPV